VGFTTEELPTPLDVSPGEIVIVPLLFVTGNPEVEDDKLPVPETLLSVRALGIDGGAVAFEDVVNDAESVFGTDADDTLELPPRGVVLVGEVPVGEDVRDALDKVPSDSDTEMELPIGG
jgi:hypothetical protein